MRCRLIALLTLLLTHQHLAAQYDMYTWSKYIVIDTIIIAKDFNNYPPHLQPRMSLSLGHRELWDIIEAIGDTFIAENTFIAADQSPQFATRIYFDSYSRCALGLPIDDKGGKIWIANLSDLPDTIHIDKWLLFHNDLPDSIWQKIEYAHCGNGSYDLYKGKIERFITYRKRSKEKTKLYFLRIDYLQNSGDSIVISRSKSKTFKVKGYSPERKEKYAFVLNGKSLSVPLTTSNFGGAMNSSFHGYPTKKDARRKYECDSCSYNYFHGERGVNRPIYRGILQL